MITIYGTYRSRATRNIWAIEELGLPWRLKPVVQAGRLRARGTLPEAADAPLNTRSPEFLRLSPAGAVPVLEDAGFLLTESLAINLYLARKAGGPMAPKDLQEEAQMLQWALFGATSLEAGTLAIQSLLAGANPDPGALTAATERLAAPLSVLERHLTHHSHMMGGRFTVADINMAEIIRYGQGHAAVLDTHPRVKSWLLLCQARPAFCRMWATREREPA